MTRVCIIAIVAVMAGLFLKKERGELVPLISLATIIIISGYLINKLREVLITIENISALAGIDKEYTVILMKMLGITYISEISQDMCIDAGFSMIGNQIAIFAKLSILSISIPIISSLIQTIITLFS